jgi:hypothetical protein
MSAAPGAGSSGVDRAVHALDGFVDLVNRPSPTDFMPITPVPCWCTASMNLEPISHRAIISRAAVLARLQWRSMRAPNRLPVKGAGVCMWNWLLEDMRDAFATVRESPKWQRSLMVVWFAWHTFEMGLRCLVIIGPLIGVAVFLGFLAYVGIQRLLGH